jgi:hypothetical protein
MRATLLLGVLRVVPIGAQQDPESESWDAQHLDPRYQNLPLTDNDALFHTDKDGLKLLARAQRDCTIPRISAARFTREEFLRDYYQKAPVVVVGLERSQGNCFVHPLIHLTVQ